MRDGNPKESESMSSKIKVVSLPMRDGNFSYRGKQVPQAQLLAYL